MTLTRPGIVTHSLGAFSIVAVIGGVRCRQKLMPAPTGTGPTRHRRQLATRGGGAVPTIPVLERIAADLGAELIVTIAPPAA